MRLFLYGTLQPAADTAMARWLAPKIAVVLAATVPGPLVAVPSGDRWYPALMPREAGEHCRGTLVDANLDEDDLAVLDRYEGREYRRCTVQARIEGDRSVSACTYLWCGAPPQGAMTIPDGDFLAWLHHTGRRAFGAHGGGD